MVLSTVLMVPVMSLDIPGLSSLVRVIDLIATSLSAFFDGSQAVNTVQHTNNAATEINETSLFITIIVL